MNIGIIAHLKHPIRKPYMGGLEAFTHDICHRLKTRGHQITLYASELSDPELNVKVILSDTDYDRETFSRFRSHELSEDFISTHHAYLETMQDIDGQEHDIIFNNSLNYVPITMASLIRTPMVTVLHTPPIFELKRAMAHEQKLGQIRYVSVSRPNADAWKPFLKDCQVIHNGVDTKSWTFNAKPTGGYVIWFGRIHPDKGTHLAIQAAKEAGRRIKIAGTIADRNYYDTYVAPLLDENVDVLGACNHDQLNELIGNADVSVITPCWDEPFGLVVAESLACGTPVAGISRGALPFILCKETGCLTTSNRTDELAACIDKAASLDRQKCRERAELTLDAEHMVDAYEALFEKVVSKSNLADVS
ncbi:glycosyltransferase family 4 protein [Mucilaginibacter sp. 21P]|uniref:glycosyltransferase family 4 protein n=1 Tax=Mucilaginibacter sp. 21P TaxID=2778902 RepID=UPI001C55E2F3|nr:glycosyltransferase family 4 protein [Mucilaginibacter sp. 21P]QXV63700.1 glycosyltransferase family 4 protein [Mucilaginibacter sp. 21P]